MRFLLVTPHTVPDFSGSGINAFNFARYLVKSGEKVNLLSLNRNMALKQKETKEGVKIRRLPYFNKNYLLKIISLIFILPGYFICAVSSDIVVIYGGRLIAWELMIIFSKVLRKKVIFQSLLDGADDLETIIGNKPVLLKGLYKRVLRKIDIYHALNTDLKTKFLRYVQDEDKVLLNPQGVDTGTFYPVHEKEKENLRDTLGLDRGRLIIITIGSLIPRKGHEEMFRLIAGLDFPCQLLVAGEYEFNQGHFLRKEDKYARKLFQSAKELSGENITFLGGVKDIVDYIRVSDIALFNSRQEGLPNALLEVMACGIPPVIRDYPGITGYFIGDRKNALVFREAGGMMDNIRLLFRDKKMREEIGCAARATVEKNASFERVLKLYQDKLTCHRTRPVSALD